MISPEQVMDVYSILPFNKIQNHFLEVYSVISGSILDENDVFSGFGQYLFQKGRIGIGSKPLLLTFKKESSGKIIN